LIIDWAFQQRIVEPNGTDGYRLCGNHGVSQSTIEDGDEDEDARGEEE
jgi:hypothetical protein